MLSAQSCATAWATSPTSKYSEGKTSVEHFPPTAIGLWLLCNLVASLLDKCVSAPCRLALRRSSKAPVLRCLVLLESSSRCQDGNTSTRRATSRDPSHWMKSSPGRSNSQQHCPCGTAQRILFGLSPSSFGQRLTLPEASLLTRLAFHRLRQ